MAEQATHGMHCAICGRLLDLHSEGNKMYPRYSPEWLEWAIICRDCNAKHEPALKALTGALDG